MQLSHKGPTAARMLSILALALALTPPATMLAQATPQVKISYVLDSLPNGLHVIYSIDHATPVVAVEVMYNVGSKSERTGKTGFAHLFEHMMFKGSRDVADGQHWSLL
jgi:zinc protease